VKKEACGGKITEGALGGWPIEIERKKGSGGPTQRMAKERGVWYRGGCGA
jgi:hypothetical protein